MKVSPHLSLLLYLGIDVSFNATCEEVELTNDDYLKILWAAAAEVPGIMYVHSTKVILT